MLNGFVGEFLVIIGSLHQKAVYAALAALGVVLAAVYLLWMYQRVFFGEITNDKNRNLADCSALEKFILTTVVIVILALGIYPQPFLRRMDPSVASTMLRVGQGIAQPVTQQLGMKMGRPEVGRHRPLRGSELSASSVRGGK